MQKTVLFVAVCILMYACSKSENTSYTNPAAGANTKARRIKFAYEGNVYGVPPIYQGLADTPKHTFDGNGISESQFVQTKAGDTIFIIIALSSEGTKPIVTVLDSIDSKPVAPVVTQMPAPDATEKFRVIVK